MAYKMKAGKEGPMKKNFPSAFKDNGDEKIITLPKVEYSELPRPRSQMYQERVEEKEAYDKGQYYTWGMPPEIPTEEEDQEWWEREQKEKLDAEVAKNKAKFYAEQRKLREESRKKKR